MNRRGLLAFGAQTPPKVYNNTSLHVCVCARFHGGGQAAFFGQMGAVRELLDSTANPNMQDAEGCTPVFLAAQEGHEEVCCVAWVGWCVCVLGLRVPSCLTRRFVGARVGLVRSTARVACGHGEVHGASGY